MTGCVSFFRGYFAFSRSFSNELLCLLSVMIPFKKCYLTKVALRFSVLAIFLGRFFGFCTEKLRFLGFDGRCGFLFFGFLAPGFLAKIKQVRFLSGSLCCPDVNQAILYVSILLSIPVKLQCEILDFLLRFTVACTRLSVSVDERKK